MTERIFRQLYIGETRVEITVGSCKDGVYTVE